ncbi:MAG TPA: ribonuclease III [Gammaproteobacteria bacterium]|nr:ribonuclease III [Gammaproteobacteria bacterium]
MSEAADWFHAQFDYRFRRPELLRRALTHRSAGADNNERLEFIGDAVLGLVIADSLHERRPGAQEGSLSRLRASLVKGSTLAGLAADIGLGERMILGAGELRSGGFRRRSILANALEALVGAVYVDGGFAAAEACVRRLFADRLASLPDAGEVVDAKTRLQELAQARGFGLPVYELTGVTGRAHEQTFEVVCAVAGLDRPGHGTGTSRRRAEQAAAQRVLEDVGGS